MSIKINGKRLKDARVMRGMTIEQLSNEIRVSKQIVSEYENQRTSPLEDRAILIARTLQLPVEFFFEEDEFNVEVAGAFFRALASTEKRERDAQSKRTIYVAKLAKVINRYIQFPALNIPRIDASKVSPREAALYIREYWKIPDGPIHNMVHLLEKNGILVTTLKGESQKVDAHFQNNIIGEESIPIIVLGGRGESAVRRQFSAAHELGHILLHERYLEIDTILKSEFTSKEREADQFAAALLLPEKEFGRDIRLQPENLNYYIKLKEKWHVSIGAMIMRARDIGVLDEVQYQNLYRRYAYKKWRSDEPLDSEIPIERPTLLQKAMDMLVNDRAFSGEAFLKMLSKGHLSLGGAMIEDLLGLREGMLSPRKTENSQQELALAYTKELASILSCHSRST